MIKLSVRLVYEYLVPGCGIVATLIETSHYVTPKVTVYVEAKSRLPLIKHHAMKTYGIQQAFHISILRLSFALRLGSEDAV